MSVLFDMIVSKPLRMATFTVFSSSSYPSEEKKKRKPRHDKSNKVKPEPGEDEGVDNRWDNQRYFFPFVIFFNSGCSVRKV